MSDRKRNLADVHGERLHSIQACTCCFESYSVPYRGLNRSFCHFEGLRRRWAVDLCGLDVFCRCKVRKHSVEDTKLSCRCPATRTHRLAYWISCLQSQFIFKSTICGSDCCVAAPQHERSTPMFTQRTNHRRSERLYLVRFLHDVFVPTHPPLPTLSSP